MKAALKRLLDDLDDIEEEHDEVDDTDMREQISEAMRHAFILPKPGYRVPDEYGLFSTEGNHQVRAALNRFLSSEEVTVASKTLLTAHKRLEAFQDNTVISKRGRFYDDYFGHAEGP